MRSILTRSGVNQTWGSPNEPLAYHYFAYAKDLWAAHGVGVLVDSRFNRDIRPDRVDEYAAAMRRGDWHDLLSDPIALTDDGQVINGQRRIAAACSVDWVEVPNDPQFLVVWGVDPSEAALADGSRRTDRDHLIIQSKVLAGGKKEG